MNIRDYRFSRIVAGADPQPWLPITIINPHTGQELKTYGRIDTGADECAFPAGFAAMLGHDLIKGELRSISTAGGEAGAYAHTTTLKVFDHEARDVMIEFMEKLPIPLLGVRSFLGRYKLIVDYPKQVFSIIES